jgi:hypothetical protein
MNFFVVKSHLVKREGEASHKNKKHGIQKLVHMTVHTHVTMALRHHRPFVVVKRKNFRFHDGSVLATQKKLNLARG